jgi:carboxymethylenebutenolidase
MSGEVERAAIALYDRFTHEGLDRRTFMAELSRICGGAAAAAAMLSSVAACGQAAPQMAPADPRLRAEELDWEVRPGRHLKIYHARPARANPRGPAVIVIHENRGLNDHIRDIARRLALAGYDAYAPDLLTPAGGTPANEDQARTMIGQLDMAATSGDGAALIHRFASARRKVGIVGFCWGGGMVDRLAIAAGGDLAAGVSFYGPAPDPAEAPHVQAAMLILLAGLDDRVNATALPWVAALRAAGKSVETTTYPGVNHAFNNDTSAARYNREAATQAWAATLDFFHRHLS